MTDTTDIKALREASEIGESSDYMTWPKVDPAKLKHVLGQLEAERQRADSLKPWKEVANKRWFKIKGLEAELSAMEGVALALRDEVRELKGDQVPVAEVLSQRIGNDTSTIDKALPTGTTLFTAPQKPVVLPSLTIGEVMHRSGFDREYAEGWVSANDNAIREIKAAGGIVKGGE